jgi:hypothetical protein
MGTRLEPRSDEEQRGVSIQSDDLESVVFLSSAVEPISRHKLTVISTSPILGTIMKKCIFYPKYDATSSLVIAFFAPLLEYVPARFFPP